MHPNYTSFHSFKLSFSLGLSRLIEMLMCEEKSIAIKLTKCLLSVTFLDRLNNGSFCRQGPSGAFFMCTR